MLQKHVTDIWFHRFRCFSFPAKIDKKKTRFSSFLYTYIHLEYKNRFIFLTGMKVYVFFFCCCCTFSCTCNPPCISCISCSILVSIFIQCIAIVLLSCRDFLFFLFSFCGIKGTNGTRLWWWLRFSTKCLFFFFCFFYYISKVITPNDSFCDKRKIK